MKILFIGLGSIGQRHLRNLLSMGRAFEFHAYRKRGNALPEEFANVHFTVHNNLEDAIASQPDITLLCAPPMLQTQVLPAIVNETKSHLFIEKPIAISTFEMEEMCQKMEAENRVSLIGYNLRKHPVHKMVADALANKDIGNVVSARASVGQYLPDWHPTENYRENYSANTNMGGGVVLDLIHEIDLLYSWFGGVKEVRSMIAKNSHLEMDVEDVAEILMRFNSGIIGQVHIDYVQRVPTRNGMIVGDDGTIFYDLLKNSFEILKPGNVGQQRVVSDFVRNDMYLGEMQDLLFAIDNNTFCSPNLRNGMEVLQIALDAKENG